MRSARSASPPSTEREPAARSRNPPLRTGTPLTPRPSLTSSPRLERVVLLCGRYEGVDERGERDAFVIASCQLATTYSPAERSLPRSSWTAVVRLLPGVLGNPDSARIHESFGITRSRRWIRPRPNGVPRATHGAGGLPRLSRITPARPSSTGAASPRSSHRWRPSCRPPVAPSGWRSQKTLRNRPDLLRNHATLSSEDRHRAILDEFERDPHPQTQPCPTTE